MHDTREELEARKIGVMLKANQKYPASFAFYILKSEMCLNLSDLATLSSIFSSAV